MVESTVKSPAVLGYYLVDEPGSPAFPALTQAVAAVKKYAPGKLACINLFPSYATVGAPGKSQLGTATFTEYLERFVSEVKPQILNCTQNSWPRMTNHPQNRSAIVDRGLRAGS